MTNNHKAFESSKKKIKSVDRLKNDNDFELVYEKGITITSEDKKIKAKYLFIKKTKNGSSKFGITVISQKGNSVWRNRLKRILREAVIKEETTLLNIADQKNSNLLVVFSPHLINQNNSKKIFLNDIKPAVLNIIKSLIKTESSIRN